MLYGEHHAAVLRYAHRRVGADSAGDLAAEVFVVAWRRWAEVPAEPLPWLYGVARNVVANHLRGRERTERLAARWEAEPPVPVRDVAEQVVARDGVYAAWARLGERDREVLALIGWEGTHPGGASRPAKQQPADQRRGPVAPANPSRGQAPGPRRLLGIVGYQVTGTVARSSRTDCCAVRRPASPPIERQYVMSIWLA
ncbi:sigma-70 family RNA polymerase sigma factor [Kitasatospora sp. NPDC049285]|uniref:RNA polymerase sigma factor n=1 Tax=Kitasatospora sp. NPDC049285 TaxID=3157096 RepID=UPI0034264794